jgi:hypothetical protein
VLAVGREVFNLGACHNMCEMVCVARRETLSRIGAVLRGLVEDGQDQLAERYGLGIWVVMSLPFLGYACHLQHVPGHQVVGNEFSSLQRITLLSLA